MFGLNLHSSLLQDFHSIIGKAPKEFVSQKLSTKSTAQANLYCKTRHQMFMLCFYMFELKLHSARALLKDFHSVIENAQKKFYKAFELQMYISQLAI